jgi:C1A family cysteine protease
MNSMAKKRAKQTPPETRKTLGSTTIRAPQRYGWRPDLPDHRDFTYAAPAKYARKNLAGNIDLRDCWKEPCFDQGQLGSCTGNAIAGAIEFALAKEGSATFTPSRLFIYYNERVIEGTVATDAGAQIRDGMKSVAGVGYCGEDAGSPPPGCPAASIWPYDISKFADQPPQACYDCAANHKVGSYLSVAQNLADMKGCLSERFPFVFGFTVYESFEEMTAPWIVPMPQQGEAVVGGHAVLAMGFDDAKSVFIVRNSWGPGWGDGGYFYMPYAYLLDDNLSDDFWTVRLAD